MWRRDRGAARDLVALANSCLVHIYALIPCLCWITLSKPCRKGSVEQGEGCRDWSLLWDGNSVAPRLAQFPSPFCLLPMVWDVPCLSRRDTQGCGAQTSPDTKLQSAVGRTDPAVPERRNRHFGTATVSV